MRLTDNDKKVCKMLGISEEDFAKSKAEELSKASGAARTTVIERALTSEQRTVAKQLGISAAEFAQSLVEDNDAAFANRLRVAASSPSGSGFKSFDRVVIDADDPARGTISFVTDSPDGLLRDGDVCTVDPGDSRGKVSGALQYLGDETAEGGPRVIQEGDPIVIDRCEGTISKVAGTGARTRSKAELRKLIAKNERKLARLEASSPRPSSKRRVYVDAHANLPGMKWDFEKNRFYVVRSAVG
jgi:hypothetical protein